MVFDKKAKNLLVKRGGETMGPKSQKMKKNMQRLGGGGAALSLEAFANAKLRNHTYNPAILKKTRELYKNAKHVNKYKKMVKQLEQQKDLSSSSSVQTPMLQEDDCQETGYAYEKSKKNGPRSLKDLYEKKHEEKEKARMEREAMIKAKKEEKERNEALRKGLRQKMYKKTRKGQPVMKYRIEHILESLQGCKE